jgi:hypothetical protein
VETVEFEMNLCYEQFLRGFNLQITTPISFLADLTRFLKEKIGYFRDRTISFLLDDYSVHRIHEPVQRILNSIIWDRQASHIFKLSAEKYGAVSALDSPGDGNANADLSREYREVDCGQFYVNLSDKEMEKEMVKFAQDLLDHRLKLAGYVGVAETILGHSRYQHGTLGKELRYEAKSRSQYHGIETIAQICSGDVSALLEAYRAIFSEGSVRADTTGQVPKQDQHRAIETVSRRFLVLVKDYHPFGSEMASILNYFGTMCRKILTESREMTSGVKNGTSTSIPCETTRIEVDQIAGNPDEEWSGPQQVLMKELVRRSVFIEMEPSRGRRTMGPTWRWQLRRIYCPAFGVGLRKYTAIKWSTSELKFFLTNPKEACEGELKKWTASSQAVGLQGSLFADSKRECNGET